MKLFGINFGKKPEVIDSEEIVDVDDLPANEEYEEIPQDNFTYEPTIPTVNTIPDEVIQRYQVKGVINLFIGIIGAIALLFVMLYVGATFILGAQDNQIKTLNQERDTLQQEMQILQPYEGYKGEVNNKLNTMYTATETDINYGTVYKDLLDSADRNDILLNNVVVSKFEKTDGTEFGACISPDPFNPTQGATGCITLQGGANDKDSLIAFLDSLQNGETKNGFKLPSISSFSYSENNDEGAKATSFQASIFFTNSFFSEKYKDLNTTVDELITPPENENGNNEGDNSEENQSNQVSEQITNITREGFRAIVVSPDEVSLSQASSIVNNVCEVGDEADTSGLGNILETAGAGDIEADTQLFLDTVKGQC